MRCGLYLDEQCEASCCKATDGSGAKDKCKEKEKVGGGEGLKVVEAKAQAHRRQSSGCTLKQGVDQVTRLSREVATWTTVRVVAALRRGVKSTQAPR